VKVNPVYTCTLRSDGFSRFQEVVDLTWTSSDALNFLHSILPLNVKPLVDSVSMGCKVCGEKSSLANVSQSLFAK